MYYLYLLLLTLLCLAQSNDGLTLVFPSINDSVRAGGSGMVTWRDYGDVTAINIYLAHGTPENYTILQVIGDNVPVSLGITMYHLPSTLPNDQVFFMVEGNDSPKTIITRSVYVEPAFVFPSISLPSGFPSISLPAGFPSISLPAGFPSISLPINIPTGQPSSPSPSATHSDDGPSIPMIVGIIVGVVGFLAIILVVAILRKRRTINRKRLALELLRQRNEKQAPPPPQKSVDVNVNVAVQPMQEQQQQHTEYNVNYQSEYNYKPQYQYDQQLNYKHTMNQPSQTPVTSSSIGPGGFVTPSSPPPKYLIPTGTSVPHTLPFGNDHPTHDNGLHASSSISTSSTIVYPPEPTYQKFTGTLSQTSSVKTATVENKPDEATHGYHKPDLVDTHKPHYKPTEHKPHSAPR